MANELIKTDYSAELARIEPTEIRSLFMRALSNVRPEIADNSCIT